MEVVYKTLCKQYLPKEVLMCVGLAYNVIREQKGFCCLIQVIAPSGPTLCKTPCIATGRRGVRGVHPNPSLLA